jgi:uncharacterized protein (TIGR02569 family)
VPPPPHVLAAFGLTDVPQRLVGGTGTSWRCGGAVLKPIEWSASPEEVEWQGEVLASLREDGFRVARPGRAGDGSALVDGWCAWTYVAGEHRARRWPEVIAVGERFHAALAHVARPSFLEARTDHWAVGDRVAWGELPAEAFAYVKHVPRLVAALRPLDAPAQVVHGDLTGNVLFADGLAPAVIDFAPYWRPTAFASAVVVGDALAWEGADESLLDAVDHIASFPQFLLRALIYRIVVDALFREGEPERPDDDCFLGPVDLACSLARRSQPR